MHINHMRYDIHSNQVDQLKIQCIMQSIQDQMQQDKTCIWNTYWCGDLQDIVDYVCMMEEIECDKTLSDKGN